MKKIIIAIFFALGTLLAVAQKDANEYNYFEVASNIAKPVTIETNLRTYKIRGGEVIKGHITRCTPRDAKGNLIVNNQAYKTETGTNKPTKKYWRFDDTYKAHSTVKDNNSSSEPSSSRERASYRIESKTLHNSINQKENVNKKRGRVNDGFYDDGSSSSLFSVSSTKKVRFSKGNLQYQASTNTWRFAEHQYDICGENNTNISSRYDGWIDLFGWGTSGVDYGFSGDISKPYNSSMDNNDYVSTYNAKHNLNGDHADEDWAWHNQIINGGKKEHIWRTMTNEEWEYLFYTRPNAPNKYASATVKNQHGFVILPDIWETPNGLYFNPGTNGWDNNKYNEVQWKEMEKAGAIFLPACGTRWGKDLYLAGEEGCYHSSSYTTWSHEAQAAVWHLYENDGVHMNGDELYSGCSVRPVQDQ